MNSIVENVYPIEGQYSVVGIDDFDHTAWPEGFFPRLSQALARAYRSEEHRHIHDSDRRTLFDTFDYSYRFIPSCLSRLDKFVRNGLITLEEIEELKFAGCLVDKE